MLEKDSYLLEKKDEEERTLLMRASDRGRLGIVKKLVEKGAKLNERDSMGMTAAHYAVMSEEVEVVKFLLKKGIDSNLKDNDGMTPLDLVDSEEMKEVFEIHKNKK